MAEKEPNYIPGTIAYQGPRVTFQVALVNVTGSINGALLLSNAIFWQNCCKTADGFWWKTWEQWCEELGLTRAQLKGAIKACGKFLETEDRGFPRKTWYRVKWPVLIQISGPHSRANLATQQGENRPTVGRKSPHCLYVRTSLYETEDTAQERGPLQDAAKELVKSFRDRFQHYPRKLDPKQTKRELAAAVALLASSTANEVLDLAAAALVDKFAGNRRAAATLEQLQRNFALLRAQYPVVQLASAPSVPSAPRRDRTLEEVETDWNGYLKTCAADGKEPNPKFVEMYERTLKRMREARHNDNRKHT